MPALTVSPRSVTLAALAATLLAACGGGGAGSTPEPQVPAASVRVVQGTLSAAGGGTVTLNGAVLSTAGASVRIDDAPRGADDLRVGQVARVRIVTDDRGAHVAEVEVEHGIEGRVDDRGADFITVAGQRIQVDGATRLGEDIPGVDAVGVGSVVQVSGLDDGRGGRHASRLDSSPRGLNGNGADDAAVDVRGFVAALVPGVGFQLHPTPDAASYWAVDASALGTVAGLVDGAFVEVATTIAPVPGTPPVIATLVAAAVRVEDRGLHGELEAEVEGYVSTVAGTTFVVSGVTVDASSATFVLGTLADLVPGVKVEAEGHMSGGVLVAKKVVFRAGVRLIAPARSISATQLTMLGRTVELPSHFLEDHLSAPLAEGDRIEVRGTPTIVGGGLVAQRLDDGPGGSPTRVWVRAIATAKAHPAPDYTYVVFGFTVTPRSDATLRLKSDGPGVDPATFHAAVAAGRTVLKVRAASEADVDTGANTILADEVEVEGDDG